jgi:hypothetical protein
MKQFGEIEEQKTWKHNHLFRVRVQGEPGASREILARGREELERLRDRWEVDFRTRLVPPAPGVGKRACGLRGR